MLAFCSFPILPNAATKVTYPKQVNISILSSTSSSLTVIGTYQLLNKDNNEITTLPTNTTLAVKKDSNGVTVTYGDVAQTAVAGFKLEELAGKDTSVVKVNNGTSYRGSFDLRMNGDKVELINYLDIEDYLKGVVPNEMPASWPKEALKAQAIAARSYAAHSLLLTTSVTSQVYKGFSSEDSRTNVAIDETAGVYVNYKGKPIQTFFFSTSGGKTANVGDVWNSNQSNFPYLVSVEDPYETSKYSNWSFTFTPQQILKSFGVTETATIQNMTLAKTGANGEVRGVTLQTSAGEVVKTGNESEIRALFPLSDTNVYNKLYSNWFDIELERANSEKILVQTIDGQTSLDSLKGQVVQTANGQISFTEDSASIQTTEGIVSSGKIGNGHVTSIIVNGKGWGHRIGMSQYGAKGYAEIGWTAEKILTHYFQGTTVSK